MKQYTIPILLINYNRPDLSEKVINRILEINPQKVYIAIDGPNPKKINDEHFVMATRNLFKNLKTDSEIYQLVQINNLGCKKAIQSAINWFFENEEMGIILEDDVLPKLSFFPFMEEVLIKYKNVDNISLVSGCNFYPETYNIKDSYYFSRYSHIWGWGTWRRIWKTYDEKGVNWKEKWKLIIKNNNFSYTESKFWYKSFKSVYNEFNDTWDHQFSFSNFLNNRLSVMPSIPLVQNLGFRSDATHNKLGINPLSKKSQELVFPLIHPKEISRDIKSDSFSKNNSNCILGL